ncbi:MAG: hypothetical protein H7836_17485 [Magnetococcus sp. YQC-3]
MNDDKFIILVIGVVLTIPTILYHNRETARIQMAQELVQKGKDPIEVGCMIDLNEKNKVLCALKASNKPQ